MLKKLILVIAILVAGLLGYAATKPDVFEVQRTASIHAPAEKIFPLINDLKAWQAWSPYEKLDPDMKRSYSGPSVGKGAVSEWEGNSNAGAGRVEITESVPSSKMVMSLDMKKPFEAHNIVAFTLTPKGETTDVTWAMHGPQPFPAKVMGVIFNCDKMVGEQFEEGLANLKALAEK